MCEVCGEGLYGDGRECRVCPEGLTAHAGFCHHPHTGHVVLVCVLGGVMFVFVFGVGMWRWRKGEIGLWRKGGTGGSERRVTWRELQEEEDVIEDRIMPPPRFAKRSNLYEQLPGSKGEEGQSSEAGKLEQGIKND